MPLAHAWVMAHCRVPMVFAVDDLSVVIWLTEATAIDSF
jgi:hypothetical protein